MRSRRSSMRPERSMAAIALSKVGASVFAAMASISLRCSAMAEAKAPGKCSGAMRSHGGTPPYGPAHGALNGLSDTKRMLPRFERAVMRVRSGTRKGPHGLASIASEVHLVGGAANAVHVRVGRTIRARGRRQAIGTTALGRFGTRNRAAVHPCRGRDDRRMLAPTMTARRAEQCGQHDTTVCDEHLTRHAAWTGMMDRQEVAVGATPDLVHI